MRLKNIIAALSEDYERLLEDYKECEVEAEKHKNEVTQVNEKLKEAEVEKEELEKRFDGYKREIEKIVVESQERFEEVMEDNKELMKMWEG